MKQPEKKVLVTGAAGFIGCQLVERLLQGGANVLGIDNLSRGTLNNLAPANRNPRFQFIQMDMCSVSDLDQMFKNNAISFVWHLVANSDISAGVSDPTVDLRDTFLSTFNLLQVMRTSNVGQLAFSSTSAVYGVHDSVLTETTGPLFPISNYGAMKLASEALISAAVESFLDRAWIFRFPNVIGARATHGIIFDLLTKLEKSSIDLEVLGDGTQQKPYLHVSELISAMLFITRQATEPLNCFNIGPDDEGVTVLDIALAVIRAAAPGTPIRFTGGNKGWVGDVPRFVYSIEKLKGLGWAPTMASTDAVARSVSEIWLEFQQRRPKLAICS